MINKIQIEFVNGKSIGPFAIERDISEYTSIYPYKFKKGKDEWDEYLFFDETVEVFTNSEKRIEAIACRKNCYIGDVNLIGLSLDAFNSLLDIKLDRAKSVKLWVNDNEQQEVYDLEEYDLQLWVDENQKIRTVFLG